MFEKMCAFSTWDLFRVTAENEFVDSFYKEADFLRIKGQVGNLLEDHFMDVVFDVNSKIDKEVWVSKVSKHCTWSFSAVEVRKKLFALASIDP